MASTKAVLLMLLFMLITVMGGVMMGKAAENLPTISRYGFGVFTIGFMSFGAVYGWILRDEQEKKNPS